MSYYVDFSITNGDIKLPLDFIEPKDNGKNKEINDLKERVFVLEEENKDEENITAKKFKENLKEISEINKKLDSNEYSSFENKYGYNIYTDLNKFNSDDINRENDFYFDGSYQILVPSSEGEVSSFIIEDNCYILDDLCTMSTNGNWHGEIMISLANKFKCFIEYQEVGEDGEVMTRVINANKADNKIIINKINDLFKQFQLNNKQKKEVINQLKV